MADELVGRPVSCPACQQVFAADARGRVTGVAPEPPDPPPPEQVGRRLRYTPVGSIIGVMVVVYVVLMASGILAGWLRSRPRRTYHTRCASNLRGVGQTMFIYANENDEWFPHVGGTTGSMLHPVGSFVSRPPGDGESSPSVDLFLLIRNGQCTPQQFVCPSSGDTPDPLPQGATQAFDFAAPRHLSYGYHWDHGPGIALLGTALDPRFTVAADKSPYVADPFLPASNQGSMTADLPRNGNSPNHGREGQNVLFADGHVEWTKDPNVGIDEDNLYTFGPSAATDRPGLAPRIGQPVHVSGVSDACIVP